MDAVQQFKNIVGLVCGCVARFSVWRDKSICKFNLLLRNSQKQLVESQMDKK